MKGWTVLSLSFAFIAFLAPVAAQAKAPSSTSAPAAPARLAFDVASIHPAAPLDMAQLRTDMQAGRMPRLGARVNASMAEYRYMSLKDLIANAYDMKPYQIDGPAWLANERFDIEARLPAGASKDQAPLMLQSLLADRFGLAAHRNSEEHRVLALVVGKDGPRLQPSPAASAPIDENAPLKPGEMTMEGPDGPVRITHHSDGSVTINMGAKGTITQKFNAQTRTLNL